MNPMTDEELALLEVEAFLNDIPQSSDYKSGLMTEEQVRDYRRKQSIEKWTAEQNIKRIKDERKEDLKMVLYFVIKEFQKVVWVVVPTTAVMLKVGFRKLTLIYLILGVATFLVRKTIFFQASQKKYDAPNTPDFISPLGATLLMAACAFVTSFVFPIAVTLAWWLITGDVLSLLQEAFPLTLIP